MVQFTLPKNSKIGKGKVWPKPEEAKNLAEFRTMMNDMAYIKRVY